MKPSIFKPFCVVVGASLLFALNVMANSTYQEKDYQAAWCSAHKGITEYSLSDKTRVDCLTEEYAIEFDWAKKWAESIGQSLYYAYSTNKKPAVVLIMTNPEKEEQFLKRLTKVAKKAGITVFVMASVNDTN